MGKNIFEDHAAFNRWQVMDGWRINDCGIRPSIYITEVKFKKLFGKLTEGELQRIFQLKAQLSNVEIDRRRRKVIKKLEQVGEENILTVLNLYLRHEDAELCARYVMACSVDKKRRRDNE